MPPPRAGDVIPPGAGHRGGGPPRPEGSRPDIIPSPPAFAVAVAITADYLAMGSGLVARLRALDPGRDLFIYTDAASWDPVTRFADRVGATDVVMVEDMGYDCGGWSAIVQAKFQILGRLWPDPIVYLDVDQLLFRPLGPYVAAFAASGALLAASPDDESFQDQFRPGCAPQGIPPEAPAINTGAFIVSPDRTLFRHVMAALGKFAPIARLPTQAIFNGVIECEGLPVHRFGDEFMAGPFSPRVLEFPRRCALIHLWTPRPPFMEPNPVRPGERPYGALKGDFSRRHGAPYPEAELEVEYRHQLALAAAL